jgi:hypothetical protein
MPDVFISYAQRSREPTEVLADQLKRRGLEVWWDTNLTGGQRFNEEIRNQLEKAKAVIVIWTPESVQSRYVTMEAGIAFGWDKLISVRTVDVAIQDIPRPFRETTHTDIVTEIERVMAALEDKDVLPKSATRRKKMTREEIFAALGQVEPSLPAAVDAWLRKCQREGFRVVAKASLIVKATIPEFGEVNFGTLFPDGKLQTNYISGSSEQIGDGGIAREYLDGVAALIEGATVNRTSKNAWNWRVEVLGSPPSISSALARGDEWIELMKTARERFTLTAGKTASG